MVQFRPRHALVTGGAGFIGSNFVRHSLKTDSEVRVINLDLLTYAGNLANLQALPDPDRHQFVHGDVCDPALVDRLLSEHAIDAIVHFAAESHVDRSINRPGDFIQMNVVGTLTLLEAARRHWLEGGRFREQTYRFQHVSTDEIYGSLGPKDSAFTETAPCLPNSPYAASKAGADHLARAYRQTYESLYHARCSNNYGPYQFPEKLIPLMIHNASKGYPMPVYGDGGNVRDWIYVEDHCAALLAVLRTGEPGEIYNIGGDSERRNIDVVREICDYLDQKIGTLSVGPRPSLIRFVEDRLGHDRRYAMGNAKIYRELGWEPKMPFQLGIRKTINWYLDNQSWVNGIVNGPYCAYYEGMYGRRLCQK